ncbi:4-(cytidine 5'-diphospho)-2-C-methyl-D-erythritol kinase [Phytoactinopolyspora halotolerans]|uniref:4-diphosphocytidyl-2-C-methyl-D-erythritol kinase n=1 Tax=Phytoactinopolyspora halotolerans TaxID=1981512 RepID=A0A6L9S4F0_9ACTN|nr:4-(cytidine 5'-diphospho)-2-C-methyl-D-erythritol kinase [Phytoactinopolyspora halotolerans]NED99513.1 4-(cytidine 5'-diphospho)-2-C-methyl-D-erythritol kinase [Phytoactinopolyspora halotolerans]
MRVTVRVPAKINVVLRVGPPRADGFHDLATVFHAVSLFDDVTADDVADGTGVRLTLDGPYARGLAADESNLAVRAAHALASAAGVAADVRLRVHKSIPVAAGLAGGSADAAGVLLACNRLWGLHWPVPRLTEVAATLGSDVPFSVLGGTALGTGRGERLEPVRVGGELHWVLAVADGELSTPEVYRRLDEIRADAGPPELPSGVVAAMERADAPAVAASMANDMEAAALSLRPSLRSTLDAGRAAGALAGIVSGSGPTCVFLAPDGPGAAALAQVLSASAPCRTTEVVTGPAVPTVHVAS